MTKGNEDLMEVDEIVSPIVRKWDPGWDTLREDPGQKVTIMLGRSATVHANRMM
jgi:hypothetical protein